VIAIERDLSGDDVLTDGENDLAKLDHAISAAASRAGQSDFL
jgi:hypothetical protein